MKKRIIVTAAITACLALCAAVWPQTEKVEKTPTPPQSPAVSAPESPGQRRKPGLAQHAGTHWKSRTWPTTSILPVASM